MKWIKKARANRMEQMKISHNFYRISIKRYVKIVNIKIKRKKLEI